MDRPSAAFLLGKAQAVEVESAKQLIFLGPQYRFMQRIHMSIPR